MNKILKEYLPYIILIVTVILVRSFIITPVKVNGGSMDDTLKNNDILFLYKLADIKRNDIVVISKEVEGNRIIKRVIGLPGDTIKCKKGIIYINDKKYNDKYASNSTSDFDEITLEDDEYFVLGDNRYISYDSRYFGAVKKEYIVGEASIRIFPFNKIGKVE